MTRVIITLTYLYLYQHQPTHLPYFSHHRVPITHTHTHTHTQTQTYTHSLGLTHHRVHALTLTHTDSVASIISPHTFVPHTHTPLPPHQMVSLTHCMASSFTHHREPLREVPLQRVRHKHIHTHTHTHTHCFICHRVPHTHVQ